MRERGKVTGIGSLLAAMVADRNWTKALNRNRLFEFWEEAVGRDVAAHARPKVIRRQVLHVEVTDSVWMQQLHLQKGSLLAALNRRIGEDDLVDIRFTLHYGANFIKPTPRKSPPPLPDPAKMAEFERFLVSIKDDEVRDSLKAIWLAQQSRD